jgi:hypothetical protein
VVLAEFEEICERSRRPAMRCFGWADLPDRYPVVSNLTPTVSAVGRAGVLKDILSVLAEALHDEGYLEAAGIH